MILKSLTHHVGRDAGWSGPRYTLVAPMAQEWLGIAVAARASGIANWTPSVSTTESPFAMGRHWENEVAARLQNVYDTDRFTIVRDNTLKDPFGISVGSRRPDFQIIDKETGRVVELVDAKWSASEEGLAAAEADAIAKYSAESLKLPYVTEPVPVRVEGQIGEWRTTNYPSGLSSMGSIMLGLGLIDVLLTGGPKFNINPNCQPNYCPTVG